MNHLNLHANDGVDEEEHDDEQGNVGQRLKRFDERPQKSSDTFAPGQQFDEAHDAEEPEEID